MKKIGVLVLIAILCTGMILSGCAATKETSADSVATVGQEMAVAPPEEAAAVAEPATGDATAVEGATDEWGIGNLENAVMPDTNRKLVYSSDFSIETSGFEKDYQRIKDALASYAGYIESESTSGQPPTTDNSAGRSTYFVLRVPVDSYDAFIGDVSNVGTVQSKNLYTEDISSNYYDNDARIEVLESRKTRLMGYLEKTTNMEEVIALEAEISDVLYELDQLKGTKRGMDNLIDYAKVSISLYEVPKASDLTIASDATIGERASNAFSMSMIGLEKFGGEFAVFMAGAVPVIILLLIILAIILVVIYLIRKLVLKIKNRNVQKKLKG